MTSIGESPMPQPRVREKRGVALMAVLLVTLAIVAIVIVASTTTLNARLISQNSERSTALYNVAQAGLEEVRNTLNTHPGDPTYFKDSGEVMVEDHVPATDASGSVIPHVFRTSWAGPSFSTSGQYGIYGTIIVKAEDDFGNAVYHRGTVFQDTFAKYAYFSNDENGIYFGGGDQVYGPVHSNDKISIAPSGVEFHYAVTTAKTIVSPGSGIFDKGYTTLVPSIAMPTTKVFGQLASLAIAGQTKIDGGLTGGPGEATTRVEFVAVDLNGDGNVTDADEGFMRVWSSNALPAAQLAKAAQYNAAAFTQFTDKDPNDNHTFLFTVDAKTVIDAGVNGNEARYINHGCDPNCESTTLNRRIFIQAIRTIRPGEELSYDYLIQRDGDDATNVDEVYSCRCGAENCRGSMLEAAKKTRKRPRQIARHRIAGKTGTPRKRVTRRGGMAERLQRHGR